MKRAAVILPMMTITLTITLLSGCISNVAGDWVGTCALFTSGEEASMDVQANVFTDNGSELDGEMTVADWMGDTRTGRLFGNRTGRFVVMRGQFLSELGYYEMEIDVERQSSARLDGDCFFRVPDGDGELFGVIEMAR
ncbi:MAG: hypothetical protein AAFV53_36995 [Myxococcota bacterium]